MAKCAFLDCNRKLPLTAYACRCKLLHCVTHLPPENHKCTYNFYEEHQKSLVKNLSTMVIKKSELLLETI